MSGARDEILARVRAAKAGAVPPVQIPREYIQAGSRTAEEVVALFCKRLGDYRAEVQCVIPAGLTAAISAAAARHDAHRLVVPPQLPDAWRPGDLELAPDHALGPRELDACDGVITGCTTAIAETGTIALTGGPYEGRRLISLVPDLHICVVGGDQIVESVPQGIARLGPAVREQRRPVTLISGPSATSDIELQRVEGVHGPRKLVVLVMEEPA